MSLRLGLLAFVFGCGFGSSTHAQCSDWREGFGAFGLAPNPLENPLVDAQISFDDGSGPALYVGGNFAGAGGVAAKGIARWNGAQWESLGALAFTHATTQAPFVTAFGVHDDGGGPALYAAGRFHSIGGVTARNIAKWDGVAWSALGPGIARLPRALLSFDDGSGAKLFVGGGSGSDGAGFSSSLAAWNGAAWADFAPTGSWGAVHALAVFDDGAGPALFAGGEGFFANNLPVSSLQKLTGASWSSVGSGVLQPNGSQGAIHALEVFDDGTGPALFLGGNFVSADGVPAQGVARWNGASAAALGAGVSGVVQDLESFDDGSGPALFIGGGIATAGGVNVEGVGRWRTGAWSALGNPPGVQGSIVNSLHGFDDGSGAGPSLYVGGRFTIAGGVRADNVARWSSSGGWSSLGVAQGFDGRVNAIGAFASGGGVEIFAAGWFKRAGATAANGFAKWNGATWNAIPIDGTILGFHSFDDGSGEKLYACGDFESLGGVPASAVASWDGAQWAPLGSGMDDGQGVHEFATFDDGAGEALWAAGNFTAIGGVAAKRVARWDGASWWSPATGPGNIVHALAVHDDGQGGGEQLYVGGGFQKVGGVFMFGVARWDGVNWSPVGVGFDPTVLDLAVFDDGAGPKLYAAGSFSLSPPATTMNRIARWDGVSWAPVGGGVTSANGSISVLEVFDDGSGAKLFAGGGFAEVGGASIANLAKWNGSAWSAAGGGVNANVFALKSLATSAGLPPSLFVGGSFTTAGAKVSARFAVLERSCPCPPQSYCSAGASSNGCVATLSSSGAPSASYATPFVVTANGVDAQRSGLVFYGVNGRGAAPWGATSSFVCVKAPLQRTGQLDSGGTAGACDGALTFDWNAFHAAQPGALGQPFQAGERVWIQGWYRDPPSSKTTALTDALEARICP